MKSNATKSRLIRPLSLAVTVALLLLGVGLILLESWLGGQLVYKLGDVRESDFSRLTIKVWTESTGAHRPEVSVHD